MFTLINEKQFEDRKFKVYANEHDYKVRIELHDNGYKSISVLKESNNNYLPSIYTKENWKEDILEGFTIETTSYGSKDKETIKLIIEGYEKAIATVEQLENQFLNYQNDIV